MQGSFVGESNVKCITILCLNAILKIHLFLVARFKPFCESIKNCLGGQVPFSKVLYMESSDFRLKDSKDYYGLAPGKSVLLRLVPSLHM